MSIRNGIVASRFIRTQSLPEYQLKRFEKLAYLIDSVDPKNFAMNHWLKMPENKDKSCPALRVDKNICGTAACALGWATTITSFRRAGIAWNDAETLFIQHYRHKTNKQVAKNIRAFVKIVRNRMAKAKGRK